MMDVAGLALPFFGLIFLGALAGQIWRRPERELGWLNVFVIYYLVTHDLLPGACSRR